MFSSSYCIPLLLYVLKATLAATLPAAPLQSPNNSTQSSNTNTTQEQQESLQLLYSNETLTSNNVSNFAIVFPIANDEYYTTVRAFGPQLPRESLLSLYRQATTDLEEKVNWDEGADIPQNYFQDYRPIHDVGGATLLWVNQCGQRYGPYQELIFIVAALKHVTTDPGVMPAQYQNRAVAYEVHFGESLIEGILVGGGLIEGTPAGNEVE